MGERPHLRIVDEAADGVDPRDPAVWRSGLTAAREALLATAPPPPIRTPAIARVENFGTEAESTDDADARGDAESDRTVTVEYEELAPGVSEEFAGLVLELWRAGVDVPEIVRRYPS